MERGVICLTITHNESLVNILLPVFATLNSSSLKFLILKRRMLPLRYYLTTAILSYLVSHAIGETSQKK